MTAIATAFLVLLAVAALVYGAVWVVLWFRLGRRERATALLVHAALGLVVAAFALAAAITGAGWAVYAMATTVVVESVLRSVWKRSGTKRPGFSRSDR